LIATALSVVFMPLCAARIIAPIPENARRTESQTGPWRPSTGASPPAHAGISDREVKQLERGIVVGETAARLDDFADSGASRTVIPAHCGQHSGDCGQFLMSV